MIRARTAVVADGTRGRRRRRLGLSPARHADPVDAGTAVHARAAARRRRERRGAAGRTTGGPVDHRHLARAVFHAAGGARSRGLVAAAGGGRGVRDRAGLRRRAACSRGSPASTGRPAYSRAFPAARRRWRCWASDSARGVDRVAAAQSLRILIVVAVVPAAYAVLGLHGSDRYVPGTHDASTRGDCVLLMTATAARRARWRSGCDCPTRSCWARWRWRSR